MLLGAPRKTRTVSRSAISRSTRHITRRAAIARRQCQHHSHNRQCSRDYCLALGVWRLAHDTGPCLAALVFIRSLTANPGDNTGGRNGNFGWSGGIAWTFLLDTFEVPLGKCSHSIFGGVTHIDTQSNALLAVEAKFQCKEKLSLVLVKIELLLIVLWEDWHWKPFPCSSTGPIGKIAHQNR